MVGSKFIRNPTKENIIYVFHKCITEN